jgi:hypothetical protein
MKGLLGKIQFGNCYHTPEALMPCFFLIKMYKVELRT